MLFLNAGLLTGAALAGIPIVIHLLLKKQPKRLPFPAIRFVKARHKVNERSLNLRKWILLALRIFAILAGVLALARPTTPTASASSVVFTGAALLLSLVFAMIALGAWWNQRSAPWFQIPAIGSCLSLAVAVYLVVSAIRPSLAVSLADDKAPVAAAFVFDVAPHMDYREANQTRLEAAKEHAIWFARQFPQDSEVAVMDSRGRSPAFSIDRAAAERTIERMASAADAKPLSDGVASALALLETSPLQRRELFVLTDLSRGSWNANASHKIRTLIEKQPDTSIFLLDLSAKNIVNRSLALPKLSEESMPVGGDLLVDCAVESVGVGGPFILEMKVDKPDVTRPIVKDGITLLPEPETRGRESGDLVAGTPTPVQFRLSGLPIGVHQGSIRLAGSDGLAADDVRFFTVRVVEPISTLVVATSRSKASSFVEMLAPSELRQLGGAPFVCQTAEFADLRSLELSPFACVCLLDPPAIDPLAIQALMANVAAGKGLVVFLGPEITETTVFHSAQAKELFGGRIGGASGTPTRTPGGENFLNAKLYDHPALQVFRGLEGGVPWERFPVFYSWNMDQLGPTSNVVVSYTDGRPALIENVVSGGRVLVFTTPATEPAQPRGRNPWNALWSGADAWPWFALVTNSARYAAGMDDDRLQLFPGQRYTVAGLRADAPDRMLLFAPNDQPLEIVNRDGAISTPSTTSAGAYRLRGFRERPLVLGYCVNLPPEATDLVKVDKGALDGFFGEGRYQLSRERNEIRRASGERRTGRELFGWLVSLLVIFLGLEHLLANRFYGAERG